MPSHTATTRPRLSLSVTALLAAFALATCLALAGCADPHPGSVVSTPAPTKAQLAASAKQATRVAEAFFHLVGRNDPRACRLLDAAAAVQMSRQARAASCESSVRSTSRRVGEAGRKRLASIKFDEANATSRSRVELTNGGRPKGRPVVAEFFGGRWLLTSLG